MGIIIIYFILYIIYINLGSNSKKLKNKFMYFSNLGFTVPAGFIVILWLARP